jgi:hypothetical protein
VQAAKLAVPVPSTVISIKSTSKLVFFTISSDWIGTLGFRAEGATEPRFTAEPTSSSAGCCKLRGGIVELCTMPSQAENMVVA